MKRILGLVLLALCVSACKQAADKATVALALANGKLAREGFERSDRFVHGWLAHADPVSGLIPRNLTNSRELWNGRDAAADNYPFLVLTASFTDEGLFHGRMKDMLAAETRLTARLDRLPDAYSFSRRSWAREPFNLDETIFDGAEYVKDGLIPITEWLGPSPWSERMTGIVDDIWKHAPLDTPFGRIPTMNTEVNGDLLQACSRLFWFTGDRKYLDWAIRLGDFYLLGDHHPTRVAQDLPLSDHFCEIFNGLAELYLACAEAAPEKREAYRVPLHELYDRLLEIGRNEHGLFYSLVNTRTGAHPDKLTDNWGYTCDGLYTLFLVDGTPAYRDATRLALAGLKQHYTGHPWQGGGMDGYADAIEGAITLHNREPAASAADWIDSEMLRLWRKQKADGVIEGWHADGNFARTSLMYSLWKTQGTHIRPWRRDIKFGAVRQADGLVIALRAQQPWQGRLVFDRPRHREVLHLPVDYPRINQFPEWFTVESNATYRLTQGWRTESVPGGALRAGLELKLAAGRTAVIRVRP